MIEKAETSLGIPSPTELSAQVEEEQKQQGKTLCAVGLRRVTKNLSCLFKSYLLICLCLDSSPVSEVSREVDQADGSSAVGSAMGMLSSLTSVVQTTVSRCLRPGRACA